MRIPLTKRVFRKPSSRRRNASSYSPQQSGLRQLRQSCAIRQLQYLLIWSGSQPIALPFLNLRPSSDLQRHLVCKFARSWLTRNFSLLFATDRETAEVSSSSPGSAANKPRKSKGPISLTLSSTTVPFAKAWCRCSNDFSWKVPIVLGSGT